MPDGNEFVPVDFEDLFELPELVDVIREAGMTHSEFLHNPQVANALMEVADNIEAAQKRHWLPDPNYVEPVAEVAAEAQDHVFDTDIEAANEEDVIFEYDEPSVA